MKEIKVNLKPCEHIHVPLWSDLISAPVFQAAFQPAGGATLCFILVLYWREECVCCRGFMVSIYTQG